MLLYSGRNVLVHPYRSFLTGSAVGCGESDKFKNAFFHKILMRDLEVFGKFSCFWAGNPQIFP